MHLRDVWNAVTYVRDADDQIIAAQIPIDHWRFLLDHVQALQDQLAARAALARLRPGCDSPSAAPDRSEK